MGIVAANSSGITHMLSTNAAARLRDEAAALGDVHLRDLLADSVRSRGLVREHGDLRVDVSRQKLGDGTVGLLLDLAAETGLGTRIAALFAGERINRSEDRPVLHMAQRDEARTAGGEFARLVDFAERQRDGRIDDVVNIGIGGSDLGPAMVSAALAGHADGPRVHLCRMSIRAIFTTCWRPVIRRERLSS